MLRILSKHKLNKKIFKKINPDDNINHNINKNNSNNINHDSHDIIENYNYLEEYFKNNNLNKLKLGTNNIHILYLYNIDMIDVIDEIIPDFALNFISVKNKLRLIVFQI